MSTQRHVYVLIMVLLTSCLLGNCASSETLFPTSTPTSTTSTLTATATFISSETPSPTVSASVVPPTLTATITSTVVSDPQWCDSFDDGIIDQTRWNLPTDPAIIYEQNEVLNFRVIETQSLEDGVWAGLDAKQADQPIREVSYRITLESYGENIPGGVGVDAFLMNEDPLFSFDVGPGPNGPGGEFSFCPDYNAEYGDCEHPTPVPDKASLPVNLRTPMQVRVLATGKEIEFYVDGEFRAGRSVTAPIGNIQFFIYADPGSTLHATIDNFCVTYTSN